MSLLAAVEGGDGEVDVVGLRVVADGVTVRDEGSETHHAVGVCRNLKDMREKRKVKKNSSWYLLPHLETQTDLSCPEFPVCCQPVRRVHEDFRDAQSFLDGLQLQSQQVALYAESFECLGMGEITEKDVRGSLGKNTGQLLV